MYTINPLPTPVPTADDPANFDARADALVAALPGFVTETNLVAQEVNQSTQLIVGTYATTNTTLTSSVASKAFTLNELYKTFVLNQSVSLWRPADSGTAESGRRMSGTITAFNSGTGAITVNVTSAAGTATSLTGWVIGSSAPIVAPSSIGAFLLMDAYCGCF